MPILCAIRALPALPIPIGPIVGRECSHEGVHRVDPVDPHKLSVTIEVVDDRETVLSTGRFATDNAGYAALRRHVSAWPERVWAVEGSNGAGRLLAQRLAHACACGSELRDG
jgi:hypothetical protein